MNKYKKKNLNIISVNAMVLILSILFLTVGYNIQAQKQFFGTFVIEVFMVLIPAFIIAGTGSRKEVLKLNKISFKNLLLTVLLAILSYPIILLLNGLFLSLLSKFIEYKNYPIEFLQRDVSLGNYIFFICIIPAICEEIFFRGVITNAYEVYGKNFAIIMSALVFSLFHFDIQNFIAPLLLGILFGYILEYTNSIYAAMAAHLTNNIVALISARYVNNIIFNYLWQTDISREIGSLELFIIILLVAISIISLIFIRYIFKYFKKESELRYIDVKIHYRDVEPIDIFNFVPIIALVILYFIYHYIVF